LLHAIVSHYVLTLFEITRRANMSENFKKIGIPSATIAAASLLLMVPMLAAAQKQPPGIETADKNVHENTGPVSHQDIVLHEGLCQAGITTTALESLGGCSILTAPGQSD
jgi:hypothetical protein